MAFDEIALAQAASEARAKAYAPYSEFAVGAALVASGGEIFTGANVENASFGLTTCAERVALFSAVAHGHRRFDAIAIALAGATTPCGACRQVLSEFSPALPVILADEHGAIVHRTTLERLLPDRFVFSG